MARLRKLTDLQIADIVELYQSGHWRGCISVQARKHEVDRDTIRYHLRKAGVLK